MVDWGFFSSYQREEERDGGREKGRDQSEKERDRIRTDPTAEGGDLLPGTQQN